MHQPVEDIWVPFNEKLEGKVPTLYADIKNLISAGMGNLLDPIGAALNLRWKLPDGTRASLVQIAAAWHAVKDDPRCAGEGLEYAASLPANNIHLDPEDVDALILSKLKEHDRSFQKRFSDWEQRPADAQLCIHSMAWGMGSEFFSKFPRFTAAFTRGDYLAAGAVVGTDDKGVPIYECGMAYPIGTDGKRHYGTIEERNDRNHQLLMNAANHGADPSVLLWELP